MPSETVSIRVSQDTKALGISTLLMVIAFISGQFSAEGVEPDGGALVLRHAGQVVRIDDVQTKPRLSILVESGQGDIVVFDGDAPLIRGSNFDLQPQWARRDRDEPEHSELLLGGTHDTHGYAWTLRIGADAARVPLRFDLTCHLQRPILLQGLEPSVLFERPTSRERFVRINQGPGNIYHGSAEEAWGNSFPAAYLWMDGVESAFFVDGGSMQWTSAENIFRFHNYRAQSLLGDGRVRFGLNVVKRNFHELPAGDLEITFYLAVRSSKEPENRLDALDRLISMVGPLHPAEAASGDLARNSPARWAAIAEGVASDLTRRDVCWAMYHLPEDRPWRDKPVFGNRAVSSFPVSPDYAVDSACIDRLNRSRPDEAWDFSTCNNYLSGWMAWLTSHPDADQQALVDGKISILPAFFDPETGLIRHGIRHADRVGSREMSWQNFMFHLEMARVHRMMPRTTFDPAVGGRFLMSLPALIELAHGEGYNFPQWFDPATKTATIQQDVPELGVIREPWQAGTYAWIMCQAHRMTGEDHYLDEAKAAIKALFTRLDFSIENERYQIHYADPVEFPITEIFGNAWGMPACLYLHKVTADERFHRWGRDFRNSLLRMTYWYESNLRDNARDNALQNLGLFRNHSGAFTGSPWESSEAALAIAEYLGQLDEPDILLLKILNTYRASSRSYFPVVMDPVVMPCPKFADHEASHLPVEDFYMLEHGGNHGGMGRCIYMSGAAFWNYQLFEANSKVMPDRVLSLNLDAVKRVGSRPVLESYVFNPTITSQTVTFTTRLLPEGTYRFASSGLATEFDMDVSLDTLAEGVGFELPAMSAVRLRITGTDDQIVSGDADWDARCGLARLYAALQTSADRLDPAEINRLADRFQAALLAYHEGRSTVDVLETCRSVLAELAGERR